MPPHSPKRIVILGSGFAGVYAYLELHTYLHGRNDIEIIMASENNAFLFVPLVHEVATGSLMPEDIVQSLNSLPLCCLKKYIHGRAVSVDLDRREISLFLFNAQSSGETPHKETAILTYDYLISAVVSETNFYDIPGAQEHTLTLKNLSDAVLIKNRIIGAFETAARVSSPDEQERLLRFVIIGAGATGLECAGELSDYIREFYKKFPDLYGKAEVLILHNGAHLLSHLHPWFDRKIRAVLARRKTIALHCNTQVTEITPTAVCAGTLCISAGTVIWAAGVKARHLEFVAQKPLNRDKHSGRIMVNSFLQLPLYPEVFIAGDQAWIADKESDQPYPMRAQFAEREGRTAARNIARLINGKSPIVTEDPSVSERLEEFVWHDQGFIVSLGRGGALAQIYGFRFSGPLAWWMYRTIYVSKIIGWRARVRTILGWTRDLFLPRDTSPL